MKPLSPSRSILSSTISCIVVLSNTCDIADCALFHKFTTTQRSNLLHLSVESPSRQGMRAMGPLSARTTSPALILCGELVSSYPPDAPRMLLTMPALRSAASTCSRNCSGIPSADATSRVCTGHDASCIARCITARRPYSSFDVKFKSTLLSGDSVLIQSTYSTICAFAGFVKRKLKCAMTKLFGRR